jgi:ribonuclease-3 family protein
MDGEILYTEVDMFSLGSTIDAEQARQMSPIELAFIGDAVYSLYVRQKICYSAEHKMGEMQKITSERVSAHGQNTFLDRVREMFTPEEEAIFLRGRNAKKGTRSKSATVAEYNRSTGIEAVVGYLYITGQLDRLNELFAAGDA